MRCFGKISFKEFKKTISNDEKLYNNYELPKRKTKNSAGYDIVSLIKYDLNPGESVLIPTGIKCRFPFNEVLIIVIRSSLGFKNGIKLVNQVGVIDSDYYNNEDNEGHIFVKIENTGKEVFKLNIGDRIAQGIFLKYNVIDNEEEIDTKRKGGIGSTNG